MRAKRKGNASETVNHANEMLVDEGSKKTVKTWNIKRNTSIHFGSYKDVSFEAANAWVEKDDWDRFRNQLKLTAMLNRPWKLLFQRKPCQSRLVYSDMAFVFLIKSALIII